MVIRAILGELGIVLMEFPPFSGFHSNEQVGSAFSLSLVPGYFVPMCRGEHSPY